MSKNTVRKYVEMLEERLLIETEYTSVFTCEGMKGNGKLRYKILPIQGAIDHWYAHRLTQFEATSRYNTKMAKSRRNIPPEKLPSN